MKIYFWLLLMMAAPIMAHAEGADGELVYRNNCTRCHTTIHVFSPRMMATVVRHMQVKAGLTTSERGAVLEYLLQSVDSRKITKVTKEGK